MASESDRKFMGSPTGEIIALLERDDPENSTFRQHTITTVHNNPQTWSVELYLTRDEVMTVLEKIAGWRRIDNA